MGLFSSVKKDEKIVTPKDKIVAVDDRFVLKENTVLMLKEKIISLTGDDFSIKDVNGVCYFKCKGKAITMRGKKEFYDANGKLLFSLKNKLLAVKKTIKVYEGDSDSKTLAVVKPKSALFLKNCEAEFFNKTTGKTDKFNMKCDVIGFRCHVYHGSDLICKIHKKFDGKLAFTGQNNYYVEIAPNVDIALMLAIGICYDEIRNDFNRKGQ
ncbi:hypothetical protein H8356DRAFT_1717014 [Neocallimastix lanati (nom. inval.)]|jgi:uncharacterized protein YxjI|uniref:DUF567-domain-containing protein n=1 Tax=Neocallimastix californiae TaxID=1754190 RepID=A0A1Y2AHL7_9FUNG|nr:hypothetical protein H8356DRAFT_1717014 [Neocallimastix sp. JGI-2020a]ORY22098.1 hypothetical protein LY90DRAFT_707256 [Neocallimastix californiae]|eukprot:ORY22098.1 hypothetical protein LY90DRAFT_707256 [Neocallimastix californiae]